MSHTNSTTNYNLPQFITTDKPFWLTDVNHAYSAIDTAIKNAQDKADTAANDATTAGNDATTALTNAATADAKGSGAVASLADAFLDTSTYSVGDYVVYNNLLYICTVDVITPGAWTGNANWSRATISGMDSDLKSEIATNAGAIITNSTAISNNRVKTTLLTGFVGCNAADSNTIGFRTVGADAVNIDNLPGYPSGKRVLAVIPTYAYPNAGNASEIAIINIYGNLLYANSVVSGSVAFGITVLYSES